MKVQLNNKLYNLPEGWDDITLNQFKQLMQLKAEEGEEVTYMLFFLSIVLDCPVFELEKVHIKSLEELNSKLNWIVTTKPKEELNQIVKIDGKKYYFNPKIDELGFGCFTFLQSKLENGFWQNPEEILSCLLLPIKEIKRDYSKYNGLNYRKYPVRISTEEFNLDKAIENSKVIGNVPINEVYSIANFFFLLLNQFTEDSLSSLQVLNQQEKKNIQEKEQTS